MRLKIFDSHLTCKVANNCLNVREWVKMVEWNKKWSHELSVSVKENPDRKKSRAIRYIRTLFEQQEEKDKSKKVSGFWNNLNMTVMVNRIETYH